MGRKYLGADVFNVAVDRMVALYKEGHRVVVSFSAGKDSGICLEICLIAARETNRLPVEVVLRDEEIMYPGTYEYAERVAARPEVQFNWLIAHQPIINVFNRKEPYWWVFDQKLKPEEWVRQPPAIAQYITQKSIDQMTIPARFPPAPGKRLYAVIGLRISESRGRMYGLFSSGGYVTGENKYGVANVRPIYDWSDSDVWKAIHDNKWDYNKAYDTMHAAGVPKNKLRIAPPTMNAAGIGELAKAAAAWPKWFNKVCTRLQGVRTAAQFGMRAVSPSRKLGETWEQAFKRECITEAPAPWIAERATKAMNTMLSAHGHHSTSPFAEVDPCYTCFANLGSWKSLCMALYNGDPFSLKTSNANQYIEPEFFRVGAGYWEGKPSF